MIHTVKGFSAHNEAEVDIFLEFHCFLHEWMNVGNLISGSSASLNPSFYTWKFSFHILLKPSLKDFEHNFASVWNEGNCRVVWTFFGIALLWHWNENWPFPVLCHCWVFQICYHVECSTLTASSFRIFNSSAGIPSPPLALFIIHLDKIKIISSQLVVMRIK